MSQNDLRQRDLFAPAIEDGETGRADKLTVAPGKLTLGDAAALGNRLAVSPGKVSRTSVMDVQMRARRGAAGTLEHETAREGVAGSGKPMPYFDKIQAAFGRHDIGDVRAHDDGEAAGAARSLGARAYATGSDVAFGESPDLHTAAHEAAHVVQQRGGVQLAGGFGREGDQYEQHADSVADAVVSGNSAEGLLDQMATTTGTSGGGSVQRAVQLYPGQPFLESLQYHGSGRWTHGGGGALSRVEQRNLHNALAERMRADGWSEPVVDNYRRFLDRGQSLDQADWYRQHGQQIEAVRRDHERLVRAPHAPRDQSSPSSPVQDTDDTALAPAEGSLGARNATTTDRGLSDDSNRTRTAPIASDGEEPRTGVQVAQGRQGQTTDDAVVGTHGLHHCASVALRRQSEDGTQVVLNHIEASDPAGPYQRYSDAVVEAAAQGGNIHSTIRINPDSQNPDYEDAATPAYGDFPQTHGELLDRIQGDLAAANPDAQISRHGDVIVMQRPNQRTARIVVGAQRGTEGQNIAATREGVALGEGEGGQDNLQVDSWPEAARRRADSGSRLREVLNERANDESRTDGERALALLGIGDLDQEGEHPSDDQVRAVADGAGVSPQELESGRSHPPRQTGDQAAPGEGSSDTDEAAAPTGGQRGGAGEGEGAPAPRERAAQPAADEEFDQLGARERAASGEAINPDHPTNQRTRRRASALRADLQNRRRLARNQSERDAAERGLATLDRAGGHPTEGQLQHVARAAGTSVDDAEEHQAIADRERPQSEPEGELGTSGGSLSHRGVRGSADIDPTTGRLRAGATVPTGGGTRGRVRVSGGQTADGGSTQGADAQVTIPTSSGRSVSVQGGVSEERDPDGELRGRDRTAGVSVDAGPVGGGVTVGSGWRCYASAVHQDASNPQRFTVPWRLQITSEFAAELEVRIGGGFSIGEERERSGNEVVEATGSSPEAIEAGRARAEEWRRSFHQMNRDRVDALFGGEDPTAGGHANHDIEYWRSASAGQSEQVRSQSTLGASITIPLGQYLELGGGYEHQGSESSEIAKHDAENVRVTQIVGSRAGADGTVGAMGTSMTVGERDIHITRVVTQANLTSAAGQVTQFLATGRTLRPDGSSVTIIEMLPTTGSVESTGIHFLGLGGTTEGQVTRTRGVRRNEETGELEEVDQSEGQHNEQQSGLAGMRQQSNTAVTAPTAADEDYVVTQTITGNREQAVRNELSETTGNARRDVSDTNVVNGTWNVTERFTQGQIEAFCNRYVARHREIAQLRGRDPDAEVSFFGIELDPTGPYDTLYHRLAGVPAQPANEEQAQQAREVRSQAISEFLGATGQDGVRLIRASAGGGSEQIITRTNADGAADTNFMSLAERQRLDAAIESWRGQIEALNQRASLRSTPAGAGAADGLDSSADVEVLRTQISNELTQMRARRVAIMNEHNYRSLPRQERLDIDASYERYAGQLDGLLSGLQGGRDAAVAASFGEETQAEQRETAATRQRAEEIRERVQALREHTLDYRRRFGQVDSESWEYRLRPADRRRSDRMFRVAEEAREQAEQYMSTGANRTNEVDTSRFEGTATSAYRTANQQYERAVEEFEAARQQLTRLNRIYANAQRGNPQSEGARSEGNGETRRRARREPDARTETEAPAATETSGDPSEGTRMGPRIRLPAARLRNCFRTAGTVGGRVQVLDPGPIELSGGGSLFIISAILAPQAGQVQDQLPPDETVFVVTFEVNDAMPDCDFYTVVGSTSGPVINTFGSRLQAFVRARDNVDGRE